jgi:hypothetical protein
MCRPVVVDEPKFHYQDNFVVTKGFYKGAKGWVTLITPECDFEDRSYRPCYGVNGDVLGIIPEEFLEARK